MEELSAILRFATLLEQRLPSISDVHNIARQAGFTAWEVFVDERLKLLDHSKRNAERELLLLLCREEFCNFSRYSRNAGGDGLRIPCLEALRNELSETSQSNYVLESDALMQRNPTLAMKYAANTRELASKQFAIERDRYIPITSSIISTNPHKFLSELAIIVANRQFNEAGFEAVNSKPSSACFKKIIDSRIVVLACLDAITRIGQAGWQGEISLSFYLHAGGELRRWQQKTCCLSLGGLPLRVGSLAPGLDSYNRGGYLFPSYSDVKADRDVIVLGVYEETSSSPEYTATLLAQVAMAIECYLTFFRAVEPSLVAAAVTSTF